MLYIVIREEENGTPKPCGGKDVDGGMRKGAGGSAGGWASSTEVTGGGNSKCTSDVADTKHQRCHRICYTAKAAR